MPEAPNGLKWVPTNLAHPLPHVPSAGAGKRTSTEESTQAAGRVNWTDVDDSLRRLPTCSSTSCPRWTSYQPVLLPLLLLLLLLPLLLLLLLLLGGVVTFELPMLTFELPLLTFELPMLTFELPHAPFCRNKQI